MGRLNEQGIQRLVGNIKEDVSSNIALVNTEVENAKGDILGIKNELTKSDNVKYTTVNGVKEFECKDGYIDNVVIEGETLVNRTIEVPSTWQSDNKRLVKISTTHTLVSGTGEFTAINISNKDISINFLIPPGTWLSEVIVPANSTYKFTPPVNSQLGVISGHEVQGWTQSDNLTFDKSLIILNGNHVGKKIPYFEGICSVGQGDKIEVLTYGDTNIFTQIGVTKGKYLDADGVTEVVNSAYGYTDYIQIENIEYYSNFKHGLNLYDSNKHFIKFVVMDKYIPAVSNAKYFRVNVTLDEINKYVITKGNIDKKQILATLKSASKTIKDVIKNINGKYYKVENCNEFVINGDTTVTSFYDVPDSNILRIAFDITKFNVIGGDYPDFTSDKIVREIFYDNKISNRGFISDGGKYAWLFFDKNVVTQQNYKEYLNNNPIRFIAQKDPTIVELPNFNPRTFANKTTVLINSGAVQCEGSFEVTGSLVSGLEVMGDKISSLDTVATNFRNIITSSELPTDTQGNDGDIWIKYI